MPLDLAPYLDFARRVSREAGRLTLRYYQQALDPTIKADGSPVTAADQGAERLIREAIASEYPSHAILGEEYGAQNQGAAMRWIIDPIDGTRSFIRSVPLYAVLLGLEIDGVAEVGVAYFPALDEMVSAASGLGCWWAAGAQPARPARVSGVERLSDALMSYTDAGAFFRLGYGEGFLRLVRACKHSPGWTDAYAYALVATGRADLALDPVMNPWDSGPFPPIFREAGGYFGDWHGHPGDGGGQALATNAALLEQALEALNGG